jgi:hypothetical protein
MNTASAETRNNLESAFNNGSRRHAPDGSERLAQAERVESHVRRLGHELLSSSAFD